MNGSRMELESPLLDKLRVFTRPEIIENESFCYTGFSEIEFREILTEYGVCFMFNFDFKSINNERYFKITILRKVPKSILALQYLTAIPDI